MSLVVAANNNISFRLPCPLCDFDSPSTCALSVVSRGMSFHPHLLLHRHALESIFAFLSFSEIRPALLVSRRWIEAVSSMRGIERGHALQSPASMDVALPYWLVCRDQQPHAFPVRVALHARVCWGLERRSAVSVSEAQQTQNKSQLDWRSNAAHIAHVSSCEH